MADTKKSLTIIERLNMGNRQEVVVFLKSMWGEKPEPCPWCGGKLEYYHKKAKKSNSRWSCSCCDREYDCIRILDELNDM